MDKVGVEIAWGNFNGVFYLFLAMRGVEHCVSACLMCRWDLCWCVDRKCALGESGRSERVAKRRKGGRTTCGRGWGWVCLSGCESFGAWVAEGVRTALHLSQGRAGSIILSEAVLLGERGAGAFKGLRWRCAKVGCGLRSERLAEAKGVKQSGSGGLLPCARAVVSGVWGEQSNGAGEFAVLWSVFGGGGVVVHCVLRKWDAGVWGTGYEVGGWGERHGALSVV